MAHPPTLLRLSTARARRARISQGGCRHRRSAAHEPPPPLAGVEVRVGVGVAVVAVAEVRVRYLAGVEADAERRRDAHERQRAARVERRGVPSQPGAAAPASAAPASAVPASAVPASAATAKALGTSRPQPAQQTMKPLEAA